VQQEKGGLGLYDLAKVLMSPLFFSFSLPIKKKNITGPYKKKIGCSMMVEIYLRKKLICLYYEPIWHKRSHHKWNERDTRNTLN